MNKEPAILQALNHFKIRLKIKLNLSALIDQNEVVSCVQYKS